MLKTANAGSSPRAPYMILIVIVGLLSGRHMNEHWSNWRQIPNSSVAWVKTHLLQPWLSPLCAQELCCFIESTSSLPHALQLPEAERCMAVVSSQAFLACGSSNKASQESNKCLLIPGLCSKCRLILPPQFKVASEPSCQMLARMCGCFC